VAKLEEYESKTKKLKTDLIERENKLNSKIQTLDSQIRTYKTRDNEIQTR